MPQKIIPIMLITQQKTWIRAFAFTAFAALAVVACKKDETPSNEVQAQLDFAKQVLQANNAMVGSSVEMGQGSEKHASGGFNGELDERCGSILATPSDPLAFPKTLAFDYGTGCTDWAGVTRSGAVTLVFDKIWEPGTTTSVTYTEFVESGVKMNGGLSFSNTSSNTGFAFNLKATALTRTEVNGDQSSVASDLNFQQTAGQFTFWDWQDDVYQITGTSAYTLANGETGALAITEALVKANNCQWVSKGKGTITWNGIVMDIDYGDGTCDNKATVTVNGVSYEITL
jgi:hypothetical protein